MTKPKSAESLAATLGKRPRGRPRKDGTPTGSERAASASPGESTSSPADPGAISLDVEQHKTGGGFSLSSLLAAGPSGEGEAKSKGKGKGDKATIKLTAADLSDFLIVPALTLLAAYRLPEDLRPDDEDIADFAAPLARIIERHVPKTGKLSADALDFGVMAFVGFRFYSRIAPALAERRAASASRAQRGGGKEKDNGRVKAGDGRSAEFDTGDRIEAPGTIGGLDAGSPGALPSSA